MRNVTVTDTFTHQQHTLDTNPYHMDSKKLQRYEKIIIAQTTRVWEHLCSRVDTLPDLIDLTECSQQQIDLIKDVVAVEKEWILDDEARLECSLLQFTDD